MMLISEASCENPPQQFGSIYQITKSNIHPMEFHLQGKKLVTLHELDKN